MAKGDFKFNFPLRVRWPECDAQGIAFNGSYLTWTEVAYSEYCRFLGFRLYKAHELNVFDTVTVKVTIEYKAPAFIDELLEVFVRVARMGNSSLIIEFELYRESSEELVATVEGIYATYDNKTRKTYPIPDEIRRLFSHFEETGELIPISQFSDSMWGKIRVRSSASSTPH